MFMFKSGSILHGFRPQAGRDSRCLFCVRVSTSPY